MKAARTIIALVAAVAFSVAPAGARDYESVEGDMTSTRIYTLDNGLKVYLSVNADKPRIQTCIAVRTGSRNDPPETTGLAHYLEHLMFKGTRSFGTSDFQAEAPFLDSIEELYERYRTLTDPGERRACYHAIDSLSQLAARHFIPNEYDKLMSGIGSTGTNAYTWFDQTVYVEDIPSNEVDNWARIQAERFRDMVIRGFHTELEAVYEEYNIGIAQDGSKVFDALFAKLFPGHPYGTQKTIGTQEHLKNPSITNIKEYFNRYYCPNNIAICMAGDLDPDEVVDIIDRHFGTWEPNPRLSAPAYDPVPDLTAPADTTVMGLEAETLLLGWKFDAASSLCMDTLSLVKDMLVNGTAGLMDLDLEQKMRLLSVSGEVIEFAEYSTLLLTGDPNQGQSLDEVRDLILGQVDRLARGDFPDDLIPAVINNKRLGYFKAMEDNYSRADLLVDAFIGGKDWAFAVGQIDRMSRITKEDVMAFAARHFGDNYAIVYKAMGNDTTLKKIEKPEITAIPANRDVRSPFVEDVLGASVEPIKPRFLDFASDIQRGETASGLPVLHVTNTENGRFNLYFRMDFGKEADRMLPDAAGYSRYIGTSDMAAGTLKMELYKLACEFDIMVTDRNAYVCLSGLDENLPQALGLVERFLDDAQADAEAYESYVDMVAKTREDERLDQIVNFVTLRDYGIYGERNSRRDRPSLEELAACGPQALVDRIRGLRDYAHTVLYYGPRTVEGLCAVVDAVHKVPARFRESPVNVHYVPRETPATEVLIAPYDAKNVYMCQYQNHGQGWTPERQPVISLFNEYFGGGMNALVFQELRETRGLAYSASAMYARPAYEGNPEYSSSFVITQNDKMMDCIGTYNCLLDSMPASQKSFDLAVQSLRKDLETERTTRFDIIMAYLSAMDRGIDHDINRDVYEALPTLTLSDIQEFEGECMARKPCRYIILGDEGDLDIESLERVGPIRRLSTEDIFGH